MLLATRAPERAKLIGVVDWRIAELNRLGVDIKINCYAELDEVMAEPPATVFVATGGMPDLDGIDGANLCQTT